MTVVVQGVACDALTRRRSAVLASRSRTRFGELDIVCRDGATVVFVEVKARRSSRFGGAKAAVGARKQRQIARVALWYLKATDQMGARARFDVVAIDGPGLETDGIEIIANAFSLPE